MQKLAIFDNAPVLQIVAQGVELWHPAVIAVLPALGHMLLHSVTYPKPALAQIALQTVVAQLDAATSSSIACAVE